MPSRQRTNGFRTRARRLGSGLMSGFWFLPTATVLLAGALALGLIEVDERLGVRSRVGFTGGPDSARALLSSIASSTLTLTALVFSITIVVLQLASGQFSPRVLRTFMRDHRNQATLGVFLATFLYSLLVLRAVRGEDGGGEQFVPGIATAVSFGLVVASVGLFVQYIHHIAGSIRVIEIIDRVSSEAIKAIERVHPPGETGNEPALPNPDESARIIVSRSRGVVTSVALDRLCRTAERGDVVLVVVPRPGDFVAMGMPLVAVYGNGDIDDDHVRAAVMLDKERDPAEDPAFGLRQLIDIAERALSPGVNDPTTATQCLDHLHDLLRRMARRSLVARIARDPDGRVRAAVRQPNWDDYVRLALDEIRHWGADSIQIHQRIGSLLDDLATVVPPERAVVLIQQRRLLQARSDALPPAEREVLYP